jgi:membrane fusion protein (multidrug efflux system)
MRIRRGYSRGMATTDPTALEPRCFSIRLPQSGNRRKPFDEESYAAFKSRVPRQSTKDNTMKVPPILATILALISFSLPACNMDKQEQHYEARKITVTTPQVKAVNICTGRYVCQIHSQRHIEVRALETGYLEAIPVREGQTVKEGDLMFKVRPILSQSELHAEVNAPFDGIIDRLRHQQGSLVQEGEILTTMSDNSVMWVYFSVPEARYFEYMANLDQNKDELKIELELANGDKFGQIGKIGAIEDNFNDQSGNIAFRADFPNPDGLLRHGQTGNVLIHRVLHDVLVIPQRATFEILDKRYVYVIDKDDVAYRREIGIQNEVEDLYVIKRGLGADDKIVLEGTRQVRDGDKVEYEAPQPQRAVFRRWDD